jgi:exo-1,4-beta-D-glucosaminidase
MGLNTIRQEGKLEQDEFFDMADEMGILVMPGWCCCDMWEHWGEWTPENFKVAVASLQDQVYRLRNHASVLVWLYGSDNPPPAEVEKMYLKILQDEQWPNPAVSSASQAPTSVTGASGVKMTGPYDYVPPNYWLADKEAGGAYGFNTETGPGPAIPPLESLKKFIPADHLWPIDEYWNFHAGGERFSTIDIFRRGMNERYGKPESLPDFLRKSEAMAYEGERAMFEAYARNKYDSTGVIQWMLNNGWPSLIWHLYDYYLVPAGGYFGTKKACETVHVQYSYDDNSVAVINGEQQAVSAVKVSAKLYNLDAALKGSREATLDLPADSAKKAFDLPAIADLNTTYFLQLELRDSSGRELSNNFYWLSTKPDVLDWKGREDTVYTPQSGFADITGLNQLPQVKLAVSSRAVSDAVRVTVKNPTKSIAFMVQLRLTGASGDDIVPVFWDDNYFSLLPGESRDVTARYDNSAVKKQPRLQVAGWNVTPSTAAPVEGK